MSGIQRFIPSRQISNPEQVTTFDAIGGSISYARLKNIIERVDTLLSNESVTASGIKFYCQRFDTDQPFEIGSDGRVDYGLTILYRFNTIV